MYVASQDASCECWCRVGTSIAYVEPHGVLCESSPVLGWSVDTALMYASSTWRRRDVMVYVRVVALGWIVDSVHPGRSYS